MNSFGEIIKIAREDKGLFLRQVAASIDIDQGIISKFEHSERIPTKPQVEKFIKFYKLNKKKVFASWLSDKIAYSLLNEENVEEALLDVVEKIKNLKKKKNE
jgi:transcriptional regulator with XRE-family HTH domain